MITSLAYGNYNALFATVRTNNWHGLTTTSNFTWGRALGTGNQVQASSSYTALNPFNEGANYGAEPFDIKFIYNMNMYYELPFYKGQHGVLGHVLGGWTVSPLFTAQSGSPIAVGYSEGNCSGCEAFGEVTTPGTSGVSADSNSNSDNAVGSRRTRATLRFTTDNRGDRHNLFLEAAPGGHQTHQYWRPVRHQHVHQSGCGLRRVPALRARLRHQLRRRSRQPARPANLECGRQVVKDMGSTKNTWAHSSSSRSPTC